MSNSRRLDYLGIAIGVLGLIPPVIELLRRDFQLALLFSLLLIVTFSWFLFAIQTGRGPHYQTTLMKKTLTLHDSGGRNATVRREQTIQARFGNLQGVWWKGNIVDGSLSDFQVDGGPPDEIERIGCSISFFKRFRNPLSKGERRTILWQYRAIDSFLSDQEASLTDAIPGTKRLELFIEFPADRLCRSAEFHVEVAGDDTQIHKGLEIQADGRRVFASVDSPKPGHTYRIDWSW